MGILFTKILKIIEFHIIVLVFQSIGSQFELLPPREIIAASDAFGEARQQLQNTELW